MHTVYCQDVQSRPFQQQSHHVNVFHLSTCLAQPTAHKDVNSDGTIHHIISNIATLKVYYIVSISH